MLKLKRIVNHISKHRVRFSAVLLFLASAAVVKLFLSVATVYAAASVSFVSPAEVATGSTFSATLSASVTSGSYSSCTAMGFVGVTGPGTVESIQAGNYPGIEVLRISSTKQEYAFRTPNCSGGSGYASGTYTLITLNIKATSPGTITLNKPDTINPTVNGSYTSLAPKAVSVKTDVCPNIAGVQATIPSGMIKNSNGDCVYPTVVPPDPTPLTNPTNPTSPTNPTNPTNPSQPTTPTAPSPGGSPSTGGGSAPRAPSVPKLQSAPVQISSEDKESIEITETEPEVEEDDVTGAIKDVTTVAYPKSIEIGWRTEFTLRDMKVKYGKGGDSKMQTVVATASDSDSSMYRVILADLSSASMYSFEISGVMADGTEATYSGRAMTRGYPVNLQFKSGDNVLAKTKITVGGYEYETDERGLRALELPSGKVEVVVFLGSGVEYSEVIEVKEMPLGEGKTIPMQEFEINATVVSSNASLAYVIASVAVVVIVALLLFFLWRKKNKSKPSTEEWQPLTSAYAPTSAPVAPPSNLNYSPLSMDGQGQVSGTPGQVYYDPYQALAQPQGELEDIYEAARREGRFRNVR